MKPTAWNLVVISPQSPCLEKIRVSCQAGLILIAAGVLAFLPGLPPKSVSDRQGFVQARVDYLNLVGAMTQ